MNTRRWIHFGLMLALVAGSGAGAQTAVFTRPGTMVVTEIKGEAVAVAEGRERALKIEERMRAEVTLRTGGKSLVAIEFGNGAVAKLASESELAVSEFWQQPHSQAGKSAEWKEEPSPSRTRVGLTKGDVLLTVKPLKVTRGSTFSLEVSAGVVRITEGVMRARVQMTEIGIGLCTLELLTGRAELERVGGAVAPLPAGKPLVLAVEVNRRTGAITVSDAPKADGAAQP